MRSQKPQVKSLIKTRHFRAKKVFRLPIAEAFSPLDGSLCYSFINETPTWVTLDRKSGVISGLAPSIARSRKFLLTVRVENDFGEVMQSFFIKILAEDFIEDFSQRLQLMLSIRNRRRFADLHAVRHSMLEYLYEVLINGDDREHFIELFNEQAKKHQITVSEEPTREEFVKVAKASDPEIEQKIRKQMNNQHVLHKAELTNIEMRNLFRQGSQPLGMIARPVWNYLGAPDRHNWSAVSNVLDAAAESVFKLRTENLVHNNETKYLQSNPKR